MILCKAINCEWDEWNNDDCSSSCGNGTRIRKREKQLIEEYGGTCTGEPFNVEECNTGPCPGIKV